MTSWKSQCHARVLVVTMLASTVTACSTEDISGEPAVAAMIGREYRVIGAVDAYGVKAAYQDKEASYVTLISIGIAGPEIAFRKRLPIGQTFRIRAASRHFKPFENGIEYVIELQNPELPPRLEVRLGLSRFNGSGEVDLNPQLYEPVVRNK